MSPTPEAVMAEVAAVAAVVVDSDVGRAVRIRWIDSGQAAHGWRDRSTVLQDSLPAIETVGLWVGESDDAVMVAGSHDLSNGNWGECQLIWKPAITRKEWL